MTNYQFDTEALRNKLRIANDIPSGPNDHAIHVSQSTIALAALIEFAKPHADEEMLAPAFELLMSLNEISLGHKQNWLLPDSNIRSKGTMGFHQARLMSLVAAGITIAKREKINKVPAAEAMASCHPSLTPDQIIGFKRNLTRKNSRITGLVRELYDGILRSDPMSFEEVKRKIRQMKSVKVRSFRKNEK
jgi:hypothetical protein